MLADALVYGQTVFKPELVIDVATLTRTTLFRVVAHTPGMRLRTRRASVTCRVLSKKTISHVVW